MFFIKLRTTKLLFVTSVSMLALLLAPHDVSANLPAPETSGSSTCSQRVFTFPTWYNGVVDEATCNIKIVNISDFIKIPLNILEILIQLVAYAAVVFIVWGGIRYTKSQGDPSQLTAAKATITNAIAGLAIALASVAIVQFISGRFSQ